MRIRDAVLVLVLAAGVVLVPLVLMGGQVRTILSNVGNSVTPAAYDAGAARTPAPTIASGTGVGLVADAAGTPPELLIIRTGELELEVTDIPEVLVRARSVVGDLGGYASDSEETSDGGGGGGGAGATVTYRVPADRWDAALDGLRSLARRVRLERTGTEEVTGQVVDLGARIANLRAAEGALQSIMGKATRITDVLEVQEKLTEVRGQIERLVAEKEHLEEQAAYGTLSATFVLPAPPAVERVQAGWDPARDVDEAVGTLIRAAQKGTTAVIWIAIVWLPVGMALGIVLGLAWLAVHVVRRRLASDEAGVAA